MVIIAYYPATVPVEIYNLFLQSGLTQSASAAVVLLIAPSRRSSYFARWRPDGC